MVVLALILGVFVLLLNPLTFFAGANTAVK
jgi:hypothetical protein